ncbi:beta-1,3-galactosyltransferase 5-like [Montipora foliosa]|uniref:beta-1,3-galactosyltransferase 5-like n=1 Tax=Montipora foliosa TaxID=591990 RepID=UPI0035F1F5F5
MPCIRKRFLHSILLILIAFSIIMSVFLNEYMYGKSIITARINLNPELEHRINLMDKKNDSSVSVLTSTKTSPSTTEAQGKAFVHKTYLLSQTRCIHKVFLLIIVISSPYNFKRRSAIRRTWAGGPSVDDKWKTVFLVGQGNGERWQNEQLEAEERMHGDLIRGTQKEHYRNLTLKTQMGLEWASKYCDFQFLVKADDDVFVHPYNLIDFLKKPKTPKTKLYMGRCPQRGVPKRGPGKYGVSWTEYNKKRYPPFCSGPAYVLSSDLIAKLVDLFSVKAPLPLEDVYIGTLVDKIGGVKAVTHPEFRTLQRGPCRYYPGIFAYHTIRNERCMFELFNFAKNAERGQTSQPPSVKIPEKNSAEHRKI